MKLKSNAPMRSVIEVGPGDYVKIGSRWEKIKSNSAHGADLTPRAWTVVIENGSRYDMWHIDKYAKAEDLK